MANFNNLVFLDHPIVPDSIMAKYRFNNGKELSVVAGVNLYSTSKDGVRAKALKVEDVSTFEVLLEGEDDVRGWQTRDEINEIFEANEV